jgi:hypothetical protein
MEKLKLSKETYNVLKKHEIVFYASFFALESTGSIGAYIKAKGRPFATKDSFCLNSFSEIISDKVLK